MNLELKLVETEKDFRIWYKLFREIFTKDEDAFSYELMHKWWPYSICLFILVDGEKAGFIFENVNIKHKCGMIFYAGLIESYRGKGIYPQITIQNEKLLLEKGAEIIVTETEDPTKYSDEKEKLIALKRLNTYVNKMGKSFISNSPVRYIRPAPPAIDVDSHIEIQDHYLLGFKVLGKPSHLDFINENLVNKITKTDFHQIYFYESIIEQGNDDIDYLGKNFRGIKMFLENLEKDNSEYFELINSNTWQNYLEDNNLTHVLTK